MSQRKLTIKQEAFAHAYIETSNASEAYRRAYSASKMKDKQVWEESCKLLKRPNVAQRVNELRADLQKRHEITVDKILNELALIGFANMEDYIQKNADGTAYVDLSKMTRAQAAAIGEITVDQYVDTQGKDEEGNEQKVVVKKVKFKLADKRAALVDMGKHLGMFVERKEVGRPGEFADLEDMSDAELAEIARGGIDRASLH